MSTKLIYLENIIHPYPLEINITVTNRQWFRELEKCLNDPKSKIFIGCDSKRDSQNIHQKIIARLDSAAVEKLPSFQMPISSFIQAQMVIVPP